MKGAGEGKRKAHGSPRTAQHTSLPTHADDGNILASAGHDGTAVHWDILRGAVVRTFRGHTGPVYSVRWAPTGDNDRLLTASEDGCAKVRRGGVRGVCRCV